MSETRGDCGVRGLLLPPLQPTPPHWSKSRLFLVEDPAAPAVSHCWLVPVSHCTPRAAIAHLQQCTSVPKQGPYHLHVTRRSLQLWLPRGPNISCKPS